MEQGATSYHSQGLARALMILRALSESGQSCTLAQLSQKLDLPKSTLVRLLNVLEGQQFVHREGNPPVYMIGHAVLEIAETFRNHISVSQIASPALKALAHTTGLTANLGILDGRSVLHVSVEEPDRPLRFRSSSGSLDHTYCTGLGKTLLSALPESALDDHLPMTEPFESFTEHTITTRAAMLRELEAIRERGYGIDAQERDPGVTCLAIVVPNTSGLNVALSVSGPRAEMEGEARERCLAALRTTASELGSNFRLLAALRAAHRSAVTGAEQ